MENLFITGKKPYSKIMNKLNEDLQKRYESIYVNDETKYFSKFLEGKDISETNKVVLDNLCDINGKVVVDLGCGEGALINEVIKFNPARAIGIDYSETAIKNAKEKYQSHNILFECADIQEFDLAVDVLISNGTFEHMDDPFSLLQKCVEKLSPGGRIYITCPHFYNLRGFIWITLSKLFNVPMSLTDVHNITPMDFKRWSDKLGVEIIKTVSYDHKRATGELMLTDMKKRLTNALRDAGMDNSKVDSVLSFCQDFFIYQEKINKHIQLDGMNMLYILQKNA
jgi:2-polyprenyl-3-methyl-5-hydroxy-6-metoxy-1,4-benzoquinol methylase